MKQKQRGNESAGAPDRGDDLNWMTGAARSAAARSPEELETLLEDVLVVRDPELLASLFGQGATLVVDNERPAHGNEEIARLALATWAGERTYVAAPRRVIQAREIALILAEQTISVARRGDDGSWRYAIVHLTVDDGTERKEP